VRRQMLEEAGATPTDDEVALHESVILERPLPRADYLAALAAWFARLEQANARSNYWDSPALHALLRGKFRDTAVRVAADLAALAAEPATGRYISAEDARRPPAAVPSLAARVKRRMKALRWRLLVAKDR